MACMSHKNYLGDVSMEVDFQALRKVEKNFDIDNVDAKHLPEILKRVLENLSSEDWKLQMEGLKQLEVLGADGRVDPLTFRHLWPSQRKLAVKIGDLSNSLRSQISREASICIYFLCERGFLDPSFCSCVLPQLFKQVGIAKAVISESAIKTILKIARELGSHYSAVLNGFSSFLSSKIGAQRQCACQAISAAFTAQLENEHSNSTLLLGHNPPSRGHPEGGAAVGPSVSISKSPTGRRHSEPAHLSPENLLLFGQKVSDQDPQVRQAARGGVLLIAQMHPELAHYLASQTADLATKKTILQILAMAEEDGEEAGVKEKMKRVSAASLSVPSCVSKGLDSRVKPSPSPQASRRNERGERSFLRGDGREEDRYGSSHRYLKVDPALRLPRSREELEGRREEVTERRPRSKVEEYKEETYLDRLHPPQVRHDRARGRQYEFYG